MAEELVVQRDTIPCGIHEGDPCIVLDCAELDPVAPAEAVVETLLEHRTAGVRWYRLRNVPVDARWWPQVAYKAESVMLGHGIRRWRLAGPDVSTHAETVGWLCTNVSGLLRQAADLTLRDLATMPPTPRAAELVAFEPESWALRPSVLDEIVVAFDGERGGTLYVDGADEGMIDQAFDCILHTHTEWRLRYLHREHDHGLTE